VRLFRRRHHGRLERHVTAGSDRRGRRRHYIDRTQLGKRPPLSPPAREAAGTTMAIDPATRANLELTRTLSGERRGSLLDAIDCTVTAAGSRLLAQRLAAPLTDSAAIARRLDAIASFVSEPAARDDVRTTLRAAPDMSRALARLSVGRGGPRDSQGYATASSPPIGHWRGWRKSRICRWTLLRRWMRCAAPRAISPASSNARWPSNCRC